MNNTLRARSNIIELLETRRLFSTISVAPAYPLAGVAPTQAIFTATLDAPSATPIKLSYSTVNGTAKAGLDYRQTISHIVIPAGATSATFSVEVLPSTATEGDKLFYVTMRASPGNTVTKEIDAAIIENSALPTVTLSDATIKIGLHHVQTSTFFVGLTNRSASPVTVNYTTQNVTAIAGVNYFPVSGSLVFAPFKTVEKIRIKIVGDAIVSPDKVFNVDILSAINATVPPDLYSRVVVEDDVAGIVRPTLTVSAPQSVRGNNLSFVATLSAPTAANVSVRYDTEPVSASATQFTPESGILTIPAGQTTGTITVPTTLNTAVNVDKTIRLVLSAPANTQIVQSSITGTILAYPTIVVSDANIDETDASPVQPLSFYVTLNAPSPIPVSITYNTVNGDLNSNDQAESAAAGVEYTDTSGTLTFAPGQTTLPISVPVSLDATANSPLFLSVNLSGAVNGVVGRGTGLGTINNLGAAVGVPTLSVSGGSITVQFDTYAVVNFTVALSNASTLPVTVNYTTQNGTATAGIDYTQTSGTLTFNPGQTSLNVPVTVQGASTTTVTKTLMLVLSAPVNATVPTLENSGTATVTQEGT
jgi:hypothetical protein